MKLFPRYLLVVLVVAAMILAGCDLDVRSDNADPPTAVVITSTPADGGNGNVAGTATGGVPSVTATTGDEPVGSPTPPDPSTATSNPDDSGPTTTPSSTTDSNQEARAEIEAIEADVVDLRGLELLEDLDEEIIDRDELARRINEIIETEYSPEEGRVDALTYWLLRLIPDRTIDLYQLQIDLLSEQVAGYYDPETKELVVVTNDGSLTVTDKVTMAHEIVHALQDQHFDLIAIDEHAIDSDHEAAITAMTEGDATLGMTDYMLGYLDPLDLAALLGESLTGADTAVLDSAPMYISEGLLFSYDAGQSFAAAIVDSGGYGAIDESFSNPPVSTEQILHPEKYIGPDVDEPMLVENPDISSDLGEGWDAVRGDVLGEWDLKIMLEDNGVSPGNAASAAEGWGGSWFDIYESDSGALALLTTRWDSDEDASEFADALASSFDNGELNGDIWSEADRYFSIVSSGDTVVMISGTDRDAVAAALAVIEQSV